MTTPLYDKAKQPSETDVETVLGDLYPLWKELIRLLYALEPQLIEEWTFSGKSYGWSMKLSHKKRPIVRMRPNEGFVGAGVLYGAKAYEAALVSDLPDRTIQALREATQYPEGRGLSIKVRSLEDVELIVQLAGIKLAN